MNKHLLRTYLMHTEIYAEKLGVRVANLIHGSADPKSVELALADAYLAKEAIDNIINTIKEAK